MLNVTENGVKITLEDRPVASPFLVLIMGVTLLLFAIGVGLSLGYLSVRGSIGAIGLIALLSYGWRVYQNKHETVHITGGEILLSKNCIEHKKAIQKKNYHLQEDDSIECSSDSLIVKNQQGKTRFTVSGFSQAQHIPISQAVLQGKQIKTQAKAIKMQG